MKLKQKYFERKPPESEFFNEPNSCGFSMAPEESYYDFVNRVNEFIKNRTDIVSITYENNFWCCVVVYEDKKGKKNE